MQRTLCAAIAALAVLCLPAPADAHNRQCVQVKCIGAWCWPVSATCPPVAAPRKEKRAHRAVHRTARHARTREVARRGEAVRLADASQGLAPGGWLIAFSGVGGAIDTAAAQRIAAAQQRTLALFGYRDTGAAVAFLARRPGAGHSVLAFSAGASAATLAPYVAGLIRASVAPPYSITTVGLYDRSPAYRNPAIPIVNFVDHSGQRHLGARNVVNLGAAVSHLDPRTGALARVASLAAAPAPQLVAALPPENNLVTGIARVPRMLGDAIAGVVSGLIGSHTAVYDIAAHTVYLPNGDRLEAHSGLGAGHDNPRLAHVRFRGPTPPNEYRLTMREKAFHGVRALRLNPVDASRMHGRDGILAHTYMRSGGQSAGCLVFRNYPAFLAAFERGVVSSIVVVARLAAGVGLSDLAPPAAAERPVVVARAHRPHRVHARVRYAARVWRHRHARERWAG